ncbi:MAG: glycosyltransferase family 4 protein [Geodermatophilaceae bacterium]|nr:glycosyltransferase family 4 protein [Geodermatophilaceae bacterium]
MAERATGRDDLLVVLSYYSPYVSGLTNVARDVAEGLAARGRRVRVITTQHDPSLPRYEVLNGVEVERAPVALRFGKGSISPGLLSRVTRAARSARLVNLHLPMLEAGLLARRATIPVVITYHCDVSLPPGIINSLQRRVIDASSRMAMKSAQRIIVTSQDYADNSRLASSIRGKSVVIPPPCHQYPIGDPSFRQTEGLHIGFLGRIVEEKGLEHLVQAFRRLPAPDARLLIGGDFSKLAGRSVIDRVTDRIGDDSRIQLLGFVREDRLADFYASIDIFALPSINAFEAFGIVQVEAMMAGVPVVASDLPGVRVPVRETGLGRIAAPADVDSIESAIGGLITSPLERERGRAVAVNLYAAAGVIDQYDDLLESLSSGSASAR